jgi:two-component system, chemotaxis family, sensor kinase CheA
MVLSQKELAGIVREFLQESRENLDLLERTLLEAEREPGWPEHLMVIFRSVHSIKGSCSFLAFERLEALLHAGETLLDRVRDGRVPQRAEVFTSLLALVDGSRAILQGIEATGEEPPLDLDATMALLERAANRRGAAAEPAAPPAALEPTPIGLEAARGAVANGKIRVDIGLLDRLMNLVGELVLVRNQLVQLSAARSSSSLGAPVQRLNLVTTELQATVMRARMQPIGNVWNRFPRLVRDLSQASGKRVRIQMEGRDTELDKSIIEAIQDPLTHAVRNAIDHGIEAAHVRAERGKPPEGTLSLRAFHEGGMVNIEITDDGAGIDVARVKRRALDQGLAAAEHLSRMSDREVLSLLFLPGFSTAAQVTTVSGRGVGMDVVRAHVEKIGGTVDVSTRLGAGTTIRIKIPLTLAIIPALIVLSGGARYALPQASLREVVRLDGDKARRAIDEVQGAPVFRLRGKLLPLAYLGRELGQADAAHDGGSIVILVLSADDRTFGLVVDDIRDTEEIVVKSLWKRLKGLSIYAGATVMGDGRVALILDAMGLGQRIGAVSDARQRAVVQRHEAATTAAETEELVLLCRIQGDGRLAIPLSSVARLEELPRSKIEHVGGAEVTQYRGEILPLLHHSRVLEERRGRPRGEAAAAPSDTVQVVVFSDAEHRVGLLVDGILDILRVRVALQRRTSRAGVLGSMVIQDRITEFLDVNRVLRAARGAPRADLRGAST